MVVGSRSMSGTRICLTIMGKNSDKMTMREGGSLVVFYFHKRGRVSIIMRRSYLSLAHSRSFTIW